MDREIKFRGKSTFNNQDWVYGHLALIDDMPSILEESMKWEDGAEMRLEEWSYVHENTIGQFTGLCDKNGKEIFEGDIVKAPLLDPIFGDILSDAFDNVPIGFNNGSFTVDYYKGRHKIYLQDLYDRLEVIGNIHDNKELLEE